MRTTHTTKHTSVQVTPDKKTRTNNDKAVKIRENTQCSEHRAQCWPTLWLDQRHKIARQRRRWIAQLTGYTPDRP